MLLDKSGEPWFSPNAANRLGPYAYLKLIMQKVKKSFET